MKNKLWKQWMISGVLVSAMVVSGGVSVSVQAEETTETEEAVETDSSAESEDDLQILFGRLRQIFPDAAFTFCNRSGAGAQITIDFPYVPFFRIDG